MFTNFLKVTLRNLYREKMYTLINILGLALAIACCLIIGIYLKSELTYDRHNTKYRQIFRIANEGNVNGKIYAAALTSMVLGPMLADEYPEIKGFVRFLEVSEEDLIRHEDMAFYGNRSYYADANVFHVFTHDIIYGDPKTALVDPTSVAMSESCAKKYFGDANPIGETISNNSGTYKITLVFADLPENTHLKYDVLYSFNKREFATPNNVTIRNQLLMETNVYTYLLMPEGYNAQAFKQISDSFWNRHMAEALRGLNITWRAWLQPLAEVHFQSEVGHDLPTGNKLYIYGFAGVALFILLVACINYIILATARAAKRSKEVGMRKTLGSSRIRLILQFLSESVFFSLIALILGLFLVEIALNLIPTNDLFGKSLVLNLRHEPVFLGCLIIFSMIIGLLSGLYPAFYLSSVPPMSAIKYSHRAGKGMIRLRELLVLIQFVITVSVIASTMLMALQMRYVSLKSLGFDKENRVVVTMNGADLIEKMPTIRKELSKNRNILGMSETNVMITQSNVQSISKIDNNDAVQEDMILKWAMVDDDYLEVMGMQIIDGRDFSKKLLTDVGASFIVNEALVKKMGWKEPLGKHISLAEGSYIGQVIGVVKDFHFASLHTQIEPFVMVRSTINTENIPQQFRSNIQGFLVLNIAREDTSKTLSFLKKIFEEFDTRHPFRYDFLDESVDMFYMSEQRFIKLIGIFTGICILISCMGLIGLSTFVTEQRTKEIGIRKALGASTWQIIFMLANRILLLVLGGAVIASLGAYYAMDEWLTGFAYHTEINPLVFLLSAAMAAAVAFITIALQSYKTAQANPVKALRYE